MNRRCFRCEHENPQNQRFCGECGAPLILSEFISQEISGKLAEAVRDRDVLETESAIKVFERAWGWAAKIGGIASALVAGLVVFLGFKASDLRSTIDSAKSSVAQNVDNTRKSVEKTSADAVKNIQKASGDAISANQSSAVTASRLSAELKKTANRTQTELKGEASTVRQEVAASQTEIQNLKKIEPEFDAMRGQLGKATTELNEQQKVIASSEDFVKKVFSSHSTYTFQLSTFEQSQAIIVPAPKGVKNSVVYLLLPVTPIEGTLQLQVRIFLQPPGSYFNIHNLVVFFWGDPPENLKQDPLNISLFPDTTDKNTIRKIELRDGRVYADGEPLPKFNMPDPDFKGSKLFPTVTP